MVLVIIFILDHWPPTNKKIYAYINKWNKRNRYERTFLLFFFLFHLFIFLQGHVLGCREIPIARISNATQPISGCQRGYRILRHSISKSLSNVKWLILLLLEKFIYFSDSHRWNLFNCWWQFKWERFQRNKSCLEIFRDTFTDVIKKRKKTTSVRNNNLVGHVIGRVTRIWTTSMVNNDTRLDRCTAYPAYIMRNLARFIDDNDRE